MLRRLSCAILLICLPVAAQSSRELWPGKWREHTRVKVEPLTPPDPSLFAEFGGDATTAEGLKAVLAFFAEMDLIFDVIVPKEEEADALAAF